VEGIFVSTEPDPIRRRCGKPANDPWTERKLSESRTRLERLGERGSEERVRVGDVKHVVAADGEATGMPARARHVDICGRVARLEIDAHHPARPATDAQVSLRYSRSTSLAWSKSEIHGAGRVVARFFAGSDILLMPTMCSPPSPIGVLSLSTGDGNAYFTALNRPQALAGHSRRRGPATRCAARSPSHRPPR